MRIPFIGGKFWYMSKYMDKPLEGIVDDIRQESIISTKGVVYDIRLITFETREEIREEKINSILKT